MQKIEPCSLVSEKLILSSIFEDNNNLATAKKMLDGTDFYDQRCKAIFIAMLALHEQNELINKESIVNFLKSENTFFDKECLESISDDFLQELAAENPQLNNLIPYLEIVKERSILRQLISVSKEIIYMAKMGGNEDQLNFVLDYAENRVKEIEANHTTNLDRNKSKITNEELMKEGFISLDDAMSHFMGIDNDRCEAITNIIHGLICLNEI